MAGRVERHAARDDAQVEPGAASQDRDPAARRDAGQGVEGVLRKSAAVNAWSGSTRSRP